MGNLIITPSTGHVNMAPYTLIWYAREYFTIGLNFPDQHHFSPVPYFLFRRSIELSIKTYLLINGYSLKRVKREIVHDLVKAHEEANKNSFHEVLETTNEIFVEIKNANAYYNYKGFEYFMIEMYNKKKMPLPNLGFLRQYSERLLSEIEPLEKQYFLNSQLD